MYTVLIADDEENIRQGLQMIIDWQGLGFAVVGAAANGEEALQKIQTLTPDLVLMDLHMPKVHGLDVIRLARERGYRGRFIVISGYSEFSYAQTAIRYGVTDYLTKPVDEEELARLVQGIAEELRKEESRNGRLSQMYQHEGASLLRSLLEKGSSAAEDVSREELRSMHLLCDIYQMALFTPYHADRKRAVVVHAEDLLGNFMPADAYECIAVNGAEAVLLKGKAACHLFERLKDRLAETIMQADSPLDSVFITYGPGVKEIAAVPESYQSACRLLGLRFYCEKGQHILGFDEARDALREPGKIDPARKEVWRDRFLEAIQGSSRRRMEDLLSEIEEDFQRVKPAEDPARLFMSDLYLQIRDGVLRFWPDRKNLFESNAAIIDTLGTRTFLYEILDYYDVTLSRVIGASGSHSGTDDTMRDVLDYIDRNFAENLKLETLAPMFGYNSAYFGKIFTREAGMNFNNYVNARRIEEAKKLLRDEHFKIYEVAERCGYSNVDYFSRKFHHYMGMSPAEYRRSENGTV